MQSEYLVLAFRRKNGEKQLTRKNRAYVRVRRREICNGFLSCCAAVAANTQGSYAVETRMDATLKHTALPTRAKLARWSMECAEISSSAACCHCIRELSNNPLILARFLFVQCPWYDRHVEPMAVTSMDSQRGIWAKFSDIWIQQNRACGQCKSRFHVKILLQPNGYKISAYWCKLCTVSGRMLHGSRDKCSRTWKAMGEHSPRCYWMHAFVQCTAKLWAEVCMCILVGILMLTPPAYLAWNECSHNAKLFGVMSSPERAPLFKAHLEPKLLCWYHHKCAKTTLLVPSLCWYHHKCTCMLASSTLNLLCDKLDVCCSRLPWCSLSTPSLACWCGCKCCRYVFHVEHVYRKICSNFSNTFLFLCSASCCQFDLPPLHITWASWLRTSAGTSS